MSKKTEREEEVKRPDAVREDAFRVASNREEPERQVEERPVVTVQTEQPIPMPRQVIEVDPLPPMPEGDPSVKKAFTKRITPELVRRWEGKRKMVRILIHKSDDDESDVPVSVNGKQATIRRGEPVDVPWQYVSALEDAVQTLYDPKTLAARQVPSYPFEIILM